MACQRNFTGKRWSGTLISPVGRLLSVVGVMLVTLTHSSAGDLDRPRQTGCSTQLPHFPDLVVPNRDGGQSYVYLNDHTAHFPQAHPVRTSRRHYPCSGGRGSDRERPHGHRDH